MNGTTATFDVLGALLALVALAGIFAVGLPIGVTVGSLLAAMVCGVFSRLERAKLERERDRERWYGPRR